MQSPVMPTMPMATGMLQTPAQMQALAPAQAQQLAASPWTNENMAKLNCMEAASRRPHDFENMSKKQLRTELEWHECQTPPDQVRYLKAWLAKYWTGNPYSRTEGARIKAREKATAWRNGMETAGKTYMQRFLGFNLSWEMIAVGTVAAIVGYNLYEVNRLMDVKQKVRKELEQYDCLGEDGPTRNSACDGVLALRDEIAAAMDTSNLARWAVGTVEDLQSYIPISKPLDVLPPEGKRFWDAVVGQWVA